MLKQEIDGYLEPVVWNILKIKIGIRAAEGGRIVLVDDLFNHLGSVTVNVAAPRIKIVEPAAHDLANIMEYISQQSPVMAEAALTAVGDMLQNLQEIPDLGGPGRVPDTREVQMYDCPVTLVYAVDDHGAVTVVAVFCTGRGEPLW